MMHDTNKKMTIAIAATFPAEPIEEPLNYWMRELDISCEIKCAPYNQVFQQLLDTSSILSRNMNGVNVILVRPDDLIEHRRSSPKFSQASLDQCNNIKAITQQFILAIKSAVRNSPMPYLILLCPAYPLGEKDPEVSSSLEQVESMIVSKLHDFNGLSLVTTPDLLDIYPPTSTFHNAISDEPGYVPFTQDFYVAAASMTARSIFLLYSKPYKVIVLDCDQTLWKGVCGEDGPDGVEIDAPHQALQEFMVAQHDAGMLICLCSKNDHEDVTSVFDCYPEMPLKQNHIISRRINWNTKSQNIRSLAEQLQLGLDSFIFIDDDPVECAEVRAQCPEVLTLQLPQEPNNIPGFLRHVWAFDHVNVTKEDSKRTVLYRQDIERNQSQQKAPSLKDFLKDLDLRVDISPVSNSQIVRIAQLSQRTNQFNMTNVRRSEQEMKALCATVNLQCYVVDAGDRFGDYGLVGVMIFRLQDRALIVDTFLLSCRALGRGIEYRMLAQLGQIGVECGVDYIEITYSPSNKNQPAIHFLRNTVGQFEINHSECITFHVPVEIASSLTYDPDTQSKCEQNNDDEKNNEHTSHHKVQPISMVVERIAKDLYDVVHIKADIESKKQIFQNPLITNDYVAPRTIIEEQLCKLWENILTIEQIGVLDNFFELGGHSLQAMRLMSRIYDKYGVQLSMRSFFNCPTVEAAAQAIDSKILEQAGMADISNYLDELDGLTESQVQDLLDEREH